MSKFEISTTPPLTPSSIPSPPPSFQLTPKTTTTTINSCSNNNEETRTSPPPTPPTHHFSSQTHLEQQQQSQLQIPSLSLPHKSINYDALPKPKSLAHLVSILHEELKYEGLDGDSIDPERIRLIIESYTSQECEWKKYAHFDDRKYTRNLVDDGNGKFNLMILCWNGHQGR